MMVSHSSHTAVASVSGAALGECLETKALGFCTTEDSADLFPWIPAGADTVVLQAWNQFLSVQVGE